MFDAHDIAVLLRSGAPLDVIETNEETLLVDAFRRVVGELFRPLWQWSITQGLKRLDMDDEEAPPCNDSSQALEWMARHPQRGIWLLLDFSPYLRYASNLRRLREVVLGQGAERQSVVLIGAKVEIPPELAELVTRFEMRLPDEPALARLLREEAFAYSREHGGRRVEVDAAAQRFMPVGTLGTVKAMSADELRALIEDISGVLEWEPRSRIEGTSYNTREFWQSVELLVRDQLQLTRDESGAPIAEPPVLWDIETDPVLVGSKLIAEAWDAAGLYQVGSFIGDSWKEWNGRFRDDVRSFLKGDRDTVSKFASRLLGSPDIYGHEEREPEQSINFVTCHDGFTLNDVVSYNNKHNEANGEDNRDGGREAAHQPLAQRRARL